MKHAGRLVNSLQSKIFGIRNLSTTALRVAQIKVPPHISQEFYNLTIEHLQKSTNSGNELTPMSFEEGNIGAKILEDLIKNDPETHESFEKVKEDNDLTGIVINGITVDDFTKAEVPSEKKHLQNPQLITKLRPHEIAAYAYGTLAGINPTDYMIAGSIVTPIFATQMNYDSNSSYLSGKELLWHNDGWSDGPANYVMLLGIVGKKEIRTEILDARDIITHFKKSGKEEYLQILSKFNDQFDFAEDYGPQLQILSQDGKIRFAQYGRFTSASQSDYQTFAGAISFLNDSINSNAIPTFGLSIDKGQALIQRNDRGLHRKTTNPKEGEPSDTVGSSIGERLLLRVHGMENEKL